MLSMFGGNFSNFSVLKNDLSEVKESVHVDMATVYQSVQSNYNKAFHFKVIPHSPMRRAVGMTLCLFHHNQEQKFAFKV